MCKREAKQPTPTKVATPQASDNSGVAKKLHQQGGQDSRTNMEEYAYNKIFVGGLHYDTRDAEFELISERFGAIVSAEVMFNRETHKSRGFGFIVFEVEKSAENVCAQIEDHVIDGKVVEVKRAIPRSKIAPGATPTPSQMVPPRPTPSIVPPAATHH